MKKYRGILGIISTLVTLVAMVFASSASFIIFHQPKTPKCLR